MSLIWIVNILSVFFLCVFFAGIVIPQILLIAFRRRLFDEPDERKIHQCVVPRLGGMAFKPVVFFSCFWRSMSQPDMMSCLRK